MKTPFPLICIDSVLCLEYTTIFYTFGYLCVPVFVYYMYDKTLLQTAVPCTEKKQKPQVFFIYTIGA